jgi:hypothetical protein
MRGAINMGKFTWDKNKTDPEIMGGSVLVCLTDITSARLQPLVEFISEVIEIKLDFRQSAGRYWIMCKTEDQEEARKKWDLLGDVVKDLKRVVDGVEKIA